MINNDIFYHTFGGTEKNPLLDDCFYCYIVYDTERDMYYSGVKTSTLSAEACIGKTYFTSSALSDFKERFRLGVEKFKIRVEYFSCKEDAMLAEVSHHKFFNVATSDKFYNMTNANGSEMCAAGTLLCKDENGKIYRITTEEYKTGNHKHACNDRMLVYIGDDNFLTSIEKKDFDETIHRTQFKDYVLCLDTTTGKNRRVPRDVYDANVNLVGITKGKVTVYHKITGEKVTLQKEDYDTSVYECRCASKTVKVLDNATQTFVNVSNEEYHLNKSKYTHPHALNIRVYDLDKRKFVRVKREEKYNDRYVCSVTKHTKLFLLDGLVFASKKKLSNYTTKKYNLILRWTKIERLTEKVPGLKIVLLKDHINGL